MAQTIDRPANPYVGTLRIFPGTLVKIAGRPVPNATRFAINFQLGPSLNPRDDLALHLSPCFTPPRIVRNSLIRGAWGLEEAWGNGTILSPHASFEIMILAENDQFKVAINGSHYCEFKYRVPYHQITHLTIDGDVEIERISISAENTTPSYQQPSAPNHQHQYQPQPSVPYPTQGNTGMPMPPMYPNLTPSGPPTHYPSMPAGPTPAAASYASGYPASGPGLSPYPSVPGAGQYQTGPYPQIPPNMSGPMPAPSGYQQGYPQQPHPQPGHSSSTSTPFGNLPIGGKALGTIAGLGLGAAAGAAALSALNPLKVAKKIMKPHKAFKHKSSGWSRSSSSSSNSSRGSFSSNSS